MSESSFDVLRYFMEDPKDNGDYELHLKGEELDRLYKACERESERKAEPMSDSKLKSACERARQKSYSHPWEPSSNEVFACYLAELSPLFAEQLNTMRELSNDLCDERTAREAAEARVKELLAQREDAMERLQYSEHKSSEAYLAVRADEEFATKQWKEAEEKLAAAEKACAEMRDALVQFIAWYHVREPDTHWQSLPDIARQAERSIATTNGPKNETAI